MAFNIALLTTAAPYIIDGANRIISLINKNKKEKLLHDRVLSHDEKLVFIEKRYNELMTINEEQSNLLKEMAEQNQRLVLTLRNTRILTIGSFLVAVTALVLVFAL